MWCAMALKTFGCRTLAALTFGALTLHGVGEAPVPPTPVVWSMQWGGGPGGSRKWLDEAHKKDLAIAARKLAESADEEAVLLVILQAAVEQYYT